MPSPRVFGHTKLEPGSLMVAIIAAVIGALSLIGLASLAQASPAELAMVAPSAPPPVRAAAKPPAVEPGAAPEAMALAERFDTHGYAWEAVLTGEADVPKLSVGILPRDLRRLQDLELKKSLFFRSLLPAALQVNGDIAADRVRLLGLRATLRDGGFLELHDDVWLDELAAHYGAPERDFDELLLRVDGVPPSLMLAQAAEESGWGTSRFAREGNALFGQYTWSEHHEGIVPYDNAEGDTTRKVRVFDSLKGAIAAYVHNLNTHAAYRQFRQTRAAGATGYELAETLERYSERKAAYIETIRLIIRSNRLHDLDGVKLADEILVVSR